MRYLFFLKYFFLIFFIAVANLSWAMDQEICSEELSSLCVQMSSSRTLSSQEEGAFVIKIQTQNGERPQDIKIFLWMQMGDHGHGSAPLDLDFRENNEIYIRNAWFVMKGLWQVFVEFDLQTDKGIHSYSFSIPIEIQD